MFPKLIRRSAKDLKERIKRFPRQRGMERQIFSFSESYKDHTLVYLSCNVSYDTDDSLDPVLFHSYCCRVFCELVLN